MIETERLLIKPLNYDQLIKYLKNDNSLETELNLKRSKRTISAELAEAFENTILPNVAKAGPNYLFSTLWTSISKTEEQMVCDLCIVGDPNEKGEIEIGYGTYDDFRNKGFMTETVRGILNWASQQKAVKSVIASTEKENVASFKVLINNQFIKSGETDSLFLWRFQIQGK